ncbi:tripartite motif-containing protein 3-like [Anneissia japonica]|uniref:tripartite motif-containing protein 3-like n=1 Tax=Anneissia japonica TaxID=1529436 RepID=UPI0014256D8B|nr:tripartite motif-containing protein 3-like [Anneissia japonica]
MATSELNQFLEEVDEKVLECTICFKRLQNPKSLNCLHSFCLACLEDWVKKNGKLTCPTCSRSYPIPTGGIQKLPPNTFIDNLLETIEKIATRDQMKCVCAKGQAKYYCQECRHYLCSPCSVYHKIFPMSANHKLHTVEDVRSMTPHDFAALHPPLCFLHNKPLEFYCTDCKTPICINCTFMDHKVWEGEHKPICISDAFQEFKETSEKLKEAVVQCKNKLQDGLKIVTYNATNLEESKDISLRDIDNHVKVMVKEIKANGDKLKNEVETIYKTKKAANDEQMDELRITISDLNTKLSFLNQLLKSDEATAMQSSERIIKALKDRINELPNMEPNDNKQIKFLINKHQIDSWQQCDIGNVTQVRTADCLQLKGVESVTQGQTIVIKIIKTEECVIHANQLNATWTHPTGEVNIPEVQENDNGDCFVTGKCTSPGVCQLYVSADGKPIRQSPVIIKVEKEGLINTIRIDKAVRDVVKCEDDYLLVSCLTNEILKYKKSGKYIDKVTLPQGVQVNRMYKMKNGNIAFSDWDDKCIKVCNMNGQVIKTIGQREIQNPFGIHVNEASNIGYVGIGEGVFIFDIDSTQKIRVIGRSGCQGNQMNGVIDVTLQNQGYLLVLEYHQSTLKLYNTEGWFLKTLVMAGDENGKLRNPRGIVVDEDDNIIVSSKNKIQLFSRDGNFIKRIDKQEDEIIDPDGLIISYHPRRVVVANNSDKTIKIFNY